MTVISLLGFDEQAQSWQDSNMLLLTFQMQFKTIVSTWFNYKNGITKMEFPTDLLMGW